MENVKKTAGGVWLTDHTNQIGKEKVPVVPRVPEAQLPRQGVPLRHQDVEVWITKHLPSTVTSKRQFVFREARTKTQTRATLIKVAA
jgi:hypothetical protein